MHIQWFPGHMTKALRMMEANIKVIDSVIYVLDARAVNACFNPAFDKVIGNRPVLYVINKCDLVEAKDLNLWIKYFRDKNLPCIASNSASNRYVNQIIGELIKLNEDLIERYRERGVRRAVRAMVIGVPNTGKSTLINSLCKGKKTITGDRPGVTRGKQWIAIDERLELLDTPGTMSPNLENQELAMHLAFIGSVNDDILDKHKLSLELIKTICHLDYLKLAKRYRLENEVKTAEELFDEIAKNRGLIVKGGEIDYDRAANVIIDDFRKTRIGRIMLEYPDA